MEAAAPLILVVDDEELIRWSLEQILGSDGHRVALAASGAEALARAAEAAPDLCLLDLKLPDADGLELLPRLLEVAPRMQVIVMTAYGSAEIEAKARRLGAVEFLRKPVDPGVLCLLLKRLLEAGAGKEHRHG
ncbi:MAG: response regulator [Nitrospirae bacterium]|nr:MAG: response regulator [Nitrospirota bacterium]